jgi:diguanylate cyclase (GGDEF)-like protein
MKTFLTPFHHRLNLDQSSPDYHRAIFLWYYLWTMASLFAFFSVFNLTKTLNYPVALAEILLFVGLMGLVYRFQSRETMQQVVWIFVGLMTFFALFYAVASIKTNDPFVWMPLFIFSNFFLLGSRHGLRINLFFLILFLGYLWSPFLQSLTVTGKINSTLALVSIFIAMYFYEISRENAYQKLNLRSRQIYRSSITDALTQLPNRTSLDQQFQRLFTEKTPQPDWHLLILDLDHFKRLNDRLGHLAGDDALKKVAGVLNRYQAQAMALGRWGGEEFLLAMNRPAKQVSDLAEAIRREVETLSPALGEKRDLTISIGIARWQASFRGIDDWIAAADTQLYQAKARGRNRVAMAEPRARSVSHEPFPKPSKGEAG